MRNKGVIQEFTLPATPQQNAHIESYHLILESAVCQRMEFENLENARDIMNRFREFYNFTEFMGDYDLKALINIYSKIMLTLNITFLETIGKIIKSIIVSN